MSGSCEYNGPSAPDQTRSYNYYTFAHICFFVSYCRQPELPAGNVGSENRRPCRLLDRSLPVVRFIAVSRIEATRFCTKGLPVLLILQLLNCGLLCQKLEDWTSNGPGPYSVQPDVF